MCREVVQAPDRGPDQAVGVLGAHPRCLGPWPVLQHEEGGDGEDQRPQPAQQHRHPDVHAVGVGHAEQTDLGLDEEEVQREEHDDAAEVAHPPPEARHASHGPPRGDLVDRRVVVDPGDLGDDGATPSRISPTHRNAGSGFTTYSDADNPASSQVCKRRLRTVRPERSEFWPRTGASRATKSPAIAVEIARAVDVAFVAPKLELVMYTENTKVVMTVLNGWFPVPHPPRDDLALGGGSGHIEGGGASGIQAPAGVVGVVTALTVAIW